MMDRRAFLISSIAGLSASGLLASAARAAAGGASRLELLTFSEVRDNVWAVIGHGGNVMVCRVGGAVFVSDSKLPAAGALLRAELKKRGMHVSHHLLTHHHMDHSGGSWAFRDAADRFAHANLAPRVESQIDAARQRLRSAATEMLAEAEALHEPELAEALREAISVEADLTAADFIPRGRVQQDDGLFINDVPIMMHYRGPAHTDNDVFVHLPQQNVLHTGDLLFHRLHPFIDAAAGATTSGWDVCLDAMIALCDSETVVIPGHGEITDVSGLRGQKEYFAKMREAVGRAVDEGRSRDEVRAMKPESVADLGNERFLSNALGVVYDELTAGG